MDDPNFAGARKETSDAKELSEKKDAILLVAAQSPAPEEGKKREIVTAKAYLNVDKLPAGGSCEIVVFLDIQEGWHINANPAQPKNLIPTEFTITSKTGVKLSEVSYPKGEEFRMPGFDEAALVYEKKAVIRGKLHIPADVKNAAFDPLEIKIRYQPCNDNQCLAPKTAKLTGKVPIAPPRAAGEVD